MTESTQYSMKCAGAVREDAQGSVRQAQRVVEWVRTLIAARSSDTPAGKRKFLGAGRGIQAPSGAGWIPAIESGRRVVAKQMATESKSLCKK